ncbi:MAG: M48 family metalloprotease [Steroidobacteraceae bacterium]|nr:M48 family metalloprotease [Steroidobacteraceae bacterium]
MRRPPGIMLALLACTALAGGAVLPLVAAGQDPEKQEEIKKEKPKKDSKEVRLGKQAHVYLTQQKGVHDDLELQDYVRRIGQKLAAVSERPDLDWQFTIDDAEDINAYATAGGYVYISRGILPYMQNEAQLAAVIAHEIGHNVAGHSMARQRQSLLAGLASAATAILTGMPALGQLTGEVGTAVIMGHGREAELEADRLGARYLAAAGYDPGAMIEMLAIMKDNETFQRERARLEGRQARVYHGVYSSHPSVDQRLQQAVAEAGKARAGGAGSTLNTEEFLKAIDGLPVGSSRRQGMLRGNRFYHADMQFTLAFPANWQVVNAPAYLLGVGPNKEHVLELRTQVPPSDLTDPRDFAMRGLANRRLDRVETLEINGLKAWTAIVRNDASPYGKTTSVRYVVIYYDNLMWVFKGASRSNLAVPAGDSLFLSTARTFRRLRSNEFELAEPHRLKVIRATESTTIAGLAQTAKIEKYPEQELRLFNGLYPKGEPKPGDMIKTVR